MQRYAQLFCNYMDRVGVKYTEQKENVIKVVYTGDNMDSIPVVVIFDKDGDPLVSFKCWSIMSFKNKEDSALKICNDLNAEYRWVKFYLDSDIEIAASMDAMIDADTCGEECLTLVKRVVSIVDDVYPRFAKARWS